MKATSKVQMENEIKSAPNMEAAFAVIGKYYDLKNAKPGMIAKSMFIAAIPKLALTVSAKPKPEHQ